MLKKGFIKLRAQYLESTAAAAALEESLTALCQEHTQFVAECQDTERQTQATNELLQATEAHARVAEQRAKEAEIRLEESERRSREVEAHLEESERQIRNGELQVADAAALSSRNVRLSPP